MKSHFKCVLLFIVFTSITSTVIAQERDESSLDSIFKSLDEYGRFESVKARAEKGNHHAQNDLAWIYLLGKEVDTNFAEAVRWFCIAAGNGNKWAQGTISEYYWTGQGLQQNYDSAFFWMEKAADASNPRSQAQMAIHVFANAKNSTDSATAYMWSRLAYLSKYKDTDKLRDSLASKMTPAQLSMGDSLSIDYLTNNLARGDSDSMIYIRNLAEAGQAIGDYRLGKTMFFDLSTDSLKREGKRLISKAAEKGYAPAEFDLGELYFMGLTPFQTNYDSAFQWYRKAAEKGNHDARMRLAYLYNWGQGTKKDRKAAKTIYQSLAAEGNYKAMRWLADYYWGDSPIKKDKVIAYALFTAAKTRGMGVHAETVAELKSKLSSEEISRSAALTADLLDSTKVKATVEGFDKE